MKSSAGIPLPRGDNVLLKGPNDPKKLPKGPKKPATAQCKDFEAAQPV